MKFKDKQIEDFDVEDDMNWRTQQHETVVNLYVKPVDDGYGVCVKLRKEELDRLVSELDSYEEKTGVDNGA